MLVSDYIEYSAGSRKLLITRNPFGFVSDYKSKQYGGVMLNDQGDLTDTDFVNKIHEILQTKNIVLEELKPKGLFGLIFMVIRLPKDVGLCLSRKCTLIG